MNDLRMAWKSMDQYEKFWFSLGIFYGISLPILTVAAILITKDMSWIIGLPFGALAFGYSMALGSSKIKEEKK